MCVRACACVRCTLVHVCRYVLSKYASVLYLMRLGRCARAQREEKETEYVYARVHVCACTLVHVCAGM
jgi:hypothetical protein